jgi:hypothetical protein
MKVASVVAGTIVAIACAQSAFAQDGCGVEWAVTNTDSPGSVAICYDEARREVITQSSGKLWAWNGTQWTERWSDPALDGADAMAYDKNRRVCYIFGGGGYDDRLWKWDGTTLTRIADDTIGGRAYVAMAFDWKRDRLVVHGGQAAGQWLYSSWGEWNPATNTWQTWGDGPIGRLYAHKMVYDPVREVCVLHGGFYFYNRNATWTWDGATWSNVTNSGPARYVANMAWDSERQQVVFHGGTTCCGEVEYSSTWTWRGGSWTSCDLQGPPRGYTNMAYDSARHVFVMPGGIGPTSSGRQWIPHTNELRMTNDPIVPSISMTGPADGAGSTCAAIGDLLTFDVVVNNPPLTLVAGQFAINYDKTVLEYVSVEGGDSPITSIPLALPNAQAGKLFWVSSVQGGGTGTTATTRVARVTFRAIANDCDGSTQISFDPGFAPILTANGNGTGASLPTTDPAPVTIDTIGPVISNVPANLSVAADAGAGCSAVREIGTPTVFDSCSTATLSWSRSDGATSLSAPWPCGTTVVTWTATDVCNRTSTATTSVTVNPYHLLDVNVAYAGSGYAASMTRCIGFRVGDVVVSDVLTFVNGAAVATLQIPIGSYTCATADDDLRSLVSQVPVTISGYNYTLSATGDSALVNGDLNDDNLVDVIDWGVLVVRVGLAAPVNTDCATTGFQPDFDGDGYVTNGDGNRLLASFLAQGDSFCNAFNSDGGIPTTRISVAELSVLTGTDASAADLNRDGLVNGKDIAIWQRAQAAARKPMSAKSVDRD